MKIRVMSDLHLDPVYFEPLNVPVTEDEANTVLVLAGDIAEGCNGTPFMFDMCKRFKSVVFVCGNHEYYKSSLNRVFDKIVDRMIEKNGGEELPSNFHPLDMSEVVIEDTVFIGATLWTDFDKMNPFAMWNAAKTMNDYRKIRCGSADAPYSRKISAPIIHALHIQHRDYIDMRTKEWEGKGMKVVVVTHHAPSSLSISEQYRGNASNAYYYSDLSEMFFNRTIDLYCHGHVHQRFDYKIHNTRIVANARGYVTKKRTEQTGFDPLFIVEV